MIMKSLKSWWNHFLNHFSLRGCVNLLNSEQSRLNFQIVKPFFLFPEVKSPTFQFNERSYFNSILLKSGFRKKKKKELILCSHVTFHPSFPNITKCTFDAESFEAAAAPCIKKEFPTTAICLSFDERGGGGWEHKIWSDFRKVKKNQFNSASVLRFVITGTKFVNCETTERDAADAAIPHAENMQKKSNFKKWLPRRRRIE